MTKMIKEFRAAPIAAVEDMVVEGYAAVLEQKTELFEDAGVKYYEIIDRQAFSGTDLSDVCFRYNHSDDFFIMARTRNKTLDLNVDEQGLKIRAALADIQEGRDLYTLIKRKDIEKMSFAFWVDKEQYDAVTHTRRILHFAKVADVSAVDFPAYDGTNINTVASARDYFKAKAEAEQKFLYEQRKKKLLLETYL